MWSSSHLAALASVNSVVVAGGAISTNPTLQVEWRGGSWELFLARRHPKYNRGWAGCWCQGIYKHKNDSYVMFGRKCTENRCDLCRCYCATLTFRHLNPETRRKLRLWTWNPETAAWYNAKKAWQTMLGNKLGWQHAVFFSTKIMLRNFFDLVC